jgi:hypothetical protein
MLTRKRTPVPIHSGCSTDNPLGQSVSTMKDLFVIESAGAVRPVMISNGCDGPARAPAFAQIGLSA